MTRWHRLVVGLGAYLLALIATAPATLVDAELRRVSEGRLRLGDARGTLWSGSGQIELRDTGGKTGVSRDISWRLVPQSLLHGNLAYGITLERNNKQFPVTFSPTRIELGNAEIHLPAAVLGLGAPKLAPLGLTGDVLIRVAGFSFARGDMEGSATLHWHAAGSAFTKVSPLGDYEIRIDGTGKHINALLRTVEGPLQLDGKGSWSPGARPTFLGTAGVPPKYEQQLAPLLRLIAVERGAGSFELNSNMTAFGP